MVRVIAVDPGETIGYALYDSDTERIVTGQCQNVLEIADWLDIQTRVLDAVVVEDFIGGGYRTAAAIHTLQVLGFVYYYAQHVGLKVVRQAPQRRLHQVPAALRLLGGAIQPTGVVPHATDALAHALAYVALLPKASP